MSDKVSATIVAIEESALEQLKTINGEPVRRSVELTRPDNTTAYDANDAICTYAAAIKQKEVVSLTGTAGRVIISISDATSGILNFTNNLTDTATSFVTDYATAFDAFEIVVTSSTSDIIFEAKTAGISFEPPTIENISLDLSGTIEHTQANVTAVAKVDTVVFTGTNGTIDITIDDVTKTLTFDTN
jgi:hypothetical protein